MTDEELETEVRTDRTNDLVRKLEETIYEAGYGPAEVFPALANLLVMRFTEATDPDRVFRLFVGMLVEEYDVVMRILDEEADRDDEPSFEG